MNRCGVDQKSKNKNTYPDSRRVFRFVDQHNKVDADRIVLGTSSNHTMMSFAILRRYATLDITLQTFERLLYPVRVPPPLSGRNLCIRNQTHDVFLPLNTKHELPQRLKTIAPQKKHERSK